MHGEALRFRPIVSFSPVYASSAEAVAAGTAFVKDICAIDFSKERNKLVDLLGAPEVVGTIDAIVKASKQ